MNVLHSRFRLKAPKLTMSICVALTSIVLACFPLSAYAQSAAEIRDLLRKQCGQNNMKSCWLYGLDLERSKGGPVDYLLAEAVHRKACLGGSANACHSVGRLLFNGKHIANDMERGIAYIVQACLIDRKDKNLCPTANNLRAWHKPNNALLSSALVEVLNAPDLPTKDDLTDKQFVDTIKDKLEGLACRVGDDSSCSFYALSELQRSFKNNGSRDKAVEYAMFGCRKSGTESCTMGARILLEFPKHKRGTDGYIRDAERAGPFIRIACSRNASACEFVRNMRKRALN